MQEETFFVEEQLVRMNEDSVLLREVMFRMQPELASQHEQSLHLREKSIHPRSETCLAHPHNVPVQVHITSSHEHVGQPHPSNLILCDRTSDTGRPALPESITLTQHRSNRSSGLHTFLRGRNVRAIMRASSS